MWGSVGFRFQTWVFGGEGEGGERGVGGEERVHSPMMLELTEMMGFALVSFAVTLDRQRALREGGW